MIALDQQRAHPARRAPRAGGALAAMVAASSSWVKPRRRARSSVSCTSRSRLRAARPSRVGRAVGHERAAALVALQVAVLVEVGQGPATVLRLMRRKPASWRTVGSCMPGLSAPVSIRWRTWVWSCTWTGTALFRFTRSPEGGAICEDSRATCAAPPLGGSSSRSGAALRAARPATQWPTLIRANPTATRTRTPRRPELSEEGPAGRLGPGLVQPLLWPAARACACSSRSSSLRCP